MIGLRLGKREGLSVGKRDMARGWGKGEGLRLGKVESVKGGKRRKG